MGLSGFQTAWTVEEALRAFQEADGDAFYIHGGTDVMVIARKTDRFDKKLAIDISRLDGLKGISEKEGCICIGAGCSHRSVADSPIICQYAPALAKACSQIGSPQIRNRGTIGGNIANASPAADTLGPLAMYRASVTLQSMNGTRVLPLRDVITGPGRISLTPGELITEIRIDKLPEDCRHGFFKLGRRRALAISRLTVSAAGRLAADGTISDLRTALGSAFPRPAVFPEIDAMAIGERPVPELLHEIAAAVAAKLPEIAGMRPSTLYKQPVSQNLLERLLGEIFEVKTDV